MAKPMIIDISQNNTPITLGERAGDAPKTCGCGGKKHGQCGTSKRGTTKAAQALMMALIAVAMVACYFLYFQ